MALYRRRSSVTAEQRAASPISMDEWASYFSYGGFDYPLIQGGTSSAVQEKVDATYRGYVEGVYKRNGIVFACMEARRLLYSEARFKFRRERNGRPGELFGTTALKPLEKPWPGGTTRKLLARVEGDVSLAGNSYSVLRAGGRIRRLRPDWVTLILGSESGSEIDADVIGYAYYPGGSGSGEEPEILLPEYVAHITGAPDPTARYRGMSWIGTVLSEVMTDAAANQHKLQFFEQGATLGHVVTLGDDAKTPEKFKQWVEKFSHAHEGAMNAYKTLFLAAGADVKVIGSSPKDIDFKSIQGHDETRVCAVARVPPIIAGMSEGLEAATYSNYGQARRAYADGWARPQWGDAAESFSNIIAAPAGAELWYDDRWIAFLQEDMKDEADIQMAQAVTMRELVNAGFEADTVKLFIQTGDSAVLTHTGLVSVQLQAPGAEAPPALPAGDEPARSLAQYIVQRAARGERLSATDVATYIDSTAVELPAA